MDYTLDRQPRDIGVDELGTNDRVLECTEGPLGVIEIHFWQGPSAGCSLQNPLKYFPHK